jgi:hypothetical protein
MVEAVGLPRQKLCLYCWTGECPKPTCPKNAIDIVDVKKPAAAKAAEKEVTL